ncbi:MAG: type II secretion system protein GspG [SAR324 cluster bacterium]|nr:type II secretion system protein GspG [SAR324 cluster bacterium]
MKLQHCVQQHQILDHGDRQRKRSGFSAAMVFTALMGIAMTLVVATPLYYKIRSQQKQDWSLDKLKLTAEAITTYYQDTGALPTLLEDLIIKPGSLNQWKGPYLSGSPNQIQKDYWGRPYIYVVNPAFYENAQVFTPPTGQTHSFMLMTCGANGDIDTDNKDGTTPVPKKVTVCDQYSTIKQWNARILNSSGLDGIVDVMFKGDDRGVWKNVHHFILAFGKETTDRLEKLDKTQKNAGITLLDVNHLSPEYNGGNYIDYRDSGLNTTNRPNIIKSAFTNKGLKVSEFYLRDPLGERFLWANKQSGDWTLAVPTAAIGRPYSKGFNRQDNDSEGDDIPLGWNEGNPSDWPSQTQKQGLLDVILVNAKVSPGDSCGNGFVSRGNWRSSAAGGIYIPGNPEVSINPVGIGNGWLSLCVKQGIGTEFVEDVYVRGYTVQLSGMLNTLLGGSFPNQERAAYLCDDGGGFKEIRGTFALETVGHISPTYIAHLGIDPTMWWMNGNAAFNMSFFQGDAFSYFALCVKKGPDPAKTVDAFLYAQPETLDIPPLIPIWHSDSSTGTIGCPGADPQWFDVDPSNPTTGVAKWPTVQGDYFYKFRANWQHGAWSSVLSLLPTAEDYHDDGLRVPGCQGDRNPLCKTNNSNVSFDFSDMVSLCTRHVKQNTYKKTLTAKITDNPANPGQQDNYVSDVSIPVNLSNRLSYGSVVFDGSKIATTRFHFSDLHLDWMGIFLKDRIKVTGNQTVLWKPEIHTGSNTVSIAGQTLDLITGQKLQFNSSPPILSPPNNINVEIDCVGCAARSLWSLFGWKYGDLINKATALYRGFEIDQIIYTCSAANETYCLEHCVNDPDCKAYADPDMRFEIGVAQYRITSINVKLSGAICVDNNIRGHIDDQSQQIAGIPQSGKTKNYTTAPSNPQSLNLRSDTQIRVKLEGRFLVAWWNLADKSVALGGGIPNTKIVTKTINDFQGINMPWPIPDVGCNSETTIRFECVSNCEYLQ